MSGYTRVIVASRLSGADVARRIDVRPSDRKGSITRIAAFIDAIAGGAYRGEVELCTGMVRAVGTITFTDQPNADEQLLIGNQTLVAKSSGASGQNQWNLTSGGTAAADAAGNAASVAALINAHTTLSKFMTASATLGVVTITIDVPGDIGNGVKLEEGAAGMANCTVAGFSTGSDGTNTPLAAGGA